MYGVYEFMVGDFMNYSRMMDINCVDGSGLVFEWSELDEFFYLVLLVN